MSLFNTIKTISKTLLSARDTVGDKSDALDNLLDKEYIYNAAEKVKDVTGNVVMEGGKLFQQAKDALSDTKISALDDVKGTIDKVTETVKKSGSDILEKVTDKEAVYEAWEEAMEFSENIKDEVKKEAKNFTDNIKKEVKAEGDDLLANIKKNMAKQNGEEE